MYTRVKEIDVTLTGDEAYQIACDIRQKLESSIRGHYYQYGWDTFISHAQPSIALMTTFYNVSGYSNLVEYHMTELKKLLETIAKEKRTTV